MRAPLDKIELIDNYLTGKLSTAEEREFVKALATDAELNQLLNIQKDILKVVQRNALKAEIRKTVSNPNIWKRWWKSIIGGSVLIIICLAFFFSQHHADQRLQTEISINNRKEKTIEPVADQHPVAASNNTPVQTTVSRVKSITGDEISFNDLATWVYPDVQAFQIDPLKGATIEGKEGTLVIVPPNAFIDENNVTIEQPVDFKLVEALKLEDMVLYNLGTISDGKALQTGGMLHFEFTCAGKKVNVNPDQPLYVEVPTNEVKKDMLLFEGKTVNGTINWKNPKPLKKFLKHVDFSQLDFLPFNFKNTVKALFPKIGYRRVTNEIIDSVYYGLKNCSRRNYRPASNTPGMPTDSVVNVCCGIDPILIQTIRTDHYANTFVATAEFTERLVELHKEEDGNDLLKIYLRNLEKNMSFSDSIVALNLRGIGQTIFERFTKQRLTNVMNIQLYDNQLKSYQQRRLALYKKAQEQFANELQSKNTAELKNLSAAAKTSLVEQLPLPRPVYQFQWAKNGWVNIDAYIPMASKDPEFVNMHVNAAVGTTLAYQWLNAISTLTPLSLNKDKVRVSFPNKKSEFAHKIENTFCFAISRKDGVYRWADARFNPYKTDKMELYLKQMTVDEIRGKLKEYDVTEKVDARLNALEWEIKNEMLIRNFSVNKIKITGSPKQRLAIIKDVITMTAFPCFLSEGNDRRLGKSNFRANQMKVLKKL